MLQMNGRRVVSFMRVSPTLLVCGLEGDRTYEFRGDAASIDLEEERVGKALGVNNNRSPSMVNNSQWTPGVPPDEEQGLDMPVYIFNEKERQLATNAAAGNDDDDGLSLPVYDFSKFE